MVITRILGGLGNQMFEYAFGLGLARKNHTRYKMNLRAFKETRIPYGLSNFSITSKEASLLEILFVKKFTPKEYYDDFYWLNYNNWPNWMTENCFKDIEDDIRKEFTLKVTLKEGLEKKCGDTIKQINESNSVSIHIRRTDYFEKENCIVLPLDYFTEAMSIISQKVQNPRYFFFSDDMDWARENFSHLPNSVFLSNKDYEDMVLMSMCKNNIISNSTFSWWGAWLNTNPNKIVISPNKWFVKSYNLENSLIPKNWITIQNKDEKQK